MKKIILAAALVLLPSGSAYAATANGTANATVVAPISVAHNSGAALNFGTFTADTGGTVTVTAGGSGSVSGRVVFVSGSANRADGFTVTGAGHPSVIDRQSGTCGYQGQGKHQCRFHFRVLLVVIESFRVYGFGRRTSAHIGRLISR